ncbi:unnamed protein product [Echinostoma caproni]|uniref:RAB3GAP2_C domain-containing protein n=1 Tax=Echinostoma caproni TaxID=27848 RepID=A0A183BAU5_9TREM|nr:unnamed protein product [Echinostoma caproni]
MLDPLFFFLLHLQKTKVRLARHVDTLWRQWIVLRSFMPPNQMSIFTDLSPEFLSQLQLASVNDPLGFLSPVSLPTTGEVTAAMKNLASAGCDPLKSGTVVPGERGSAVLASLTVYTRPDLLIQLFRLIDALKESKVSLM